MKIVNSSEAHPEIKSLGFEVVKRLGKGSYGQAWVVQNREDGCRYAMKEITKGKYQETEIGVLQRVRGHPNIVEYWGHFKSAGQGSIYLLMEHVQGGTLTDRVQWQKRKKRKFKERLITMWAKELAEGLAHIHGMGVIHRDIKCENVFLTLDNNVKIGDFGMSCTPLPRKRSYTVCGSPSFMSPEMWTGEVYSELTDMWSYGIVLYELVSLKKPFQGTTQAELKRVVTTQLSPPPPASYSAPLRSLITALLSPAPESRPDAAQIPFILGASSFSASHSCSSGEGGWI
eukprot:TRINITY_DN3336_c0_g3_i1.p1 TRINITY_DN3336_c0_g3~~TRINITY_DN3336_c0_g3_i1.p1  ORF type:complete len:287 (+),score=35.79 TRINITY_DN3336_c0_g3_i1:189-1049(+)